MTHEAEPPTSIDGRDDGKPPSRMKLQGLGFPACPRSAPGASHPPRSASRLCRCPRPQASDAIAPRPSDRVRRISGRRLAPRRWDSDSRGRTRFQRGEHSLTRRRPVVGRDDSDDGGLRQQMPHNTHRPPYRRCPHADEPMPPGVADHRLPDVPTNGKVRVQAMTARVPLRNPHAQKGLAIQRPAEPCVSG